MWKGGGKGRGGRLAKRLWEGIKWKGEGEVGFGGWVGRDEEVVLELLERLRICWRWVGRRGLEVPKLKKVRAWDADADAEATLCGMRRGGRDAVMRVVRRTLERPCIRI